MNRNSVIQHSITPPAAPKNLLEKAYLSIQEWVFLTGIGRSNTYLFIVDDRLKTVKIGRRRLIPASEVEDFFARQGK